MLRQLFKVSHESSHVYSPSMYRDESRPSTVCLFTEDGGKFLLFFDLLFVKDSPQLVQCIAPVSAKV